MRVGDRRARLTIPDLMRVVMAMAVFAALWPVVQHGLDNSSGLSTGDAYLLTLAAPAILLVLLVLSYRASLGGGAR